MITNAPTDNLYKFLTFLGIVLFAFSTWTLSDLFLQVDREISKAETASRTVERKSAAITSRLGGLKTSQAEIRERLSRRDQEPLTRDELTDLLARSEQLIEQLNETEVSHRELDRETDGLLPITAEARVLLRHLNAFAWMLYIGAGLGIAMSGMGILMWYFLHQRYQDAILFDQSVRRAGTSNQIENPTNEGSRSGNLD